VLAADDTVLEVGVPLEEAEDLFLKEGKKMLRLINNGFDSIFFNPALVIDLGLFDVLKQKN